MHIYHYLKKTVNPTASKNTDSSCPIDLFTIIIGCVRSEAENHCILTKQEGKELKEARLQEVSVPDTALLGWAGTENEVTMERGS